MKKRDDKQAEDCDGRRTKSSKWQAEQLEKDRVYCFQMGDEHHAAGRNKPPTYSRGFEY